MIAKTTVKKKRSNKEEQLQVAVSAYIRANYPDVIFTAESSGVRMNIGQAMKLKAQRSEGKLPDVMILEPNKEFAGLIMELKAEDNSPYLKDGSLSADKHVLAQHKTLMHLSNKGHKALFVIGYKQAIETIDNYMK